MDQSGGIRRTGSRHIRRCSAERGPGAWQIDMGIGKHIPLTERAQLEFRAEFFNIFNHPQYGLPLSDFSVAPGSKWLCEHHQHGEHHDSD